MGKQGHLHDSTANPLSKELLEGDMLQLHQGHRVGPLCKVGSHLHPWGRETGPRSHVNPPSTALCPWLQLRSSLTHSDWGGWSCTPGTTGEPPDLVTPGITPIQVFLDVGFKDQREELTMKPQSALGRIWKKGPQPRETFLLWLGPHQLWSENSSWEQLFSPIKMVEFWCWEFHGNLHQDIFYLWGFFMGILPLTGQ